MERARPNSHILTKKIDHPKSSEAKTCMESQSFHEKTTGELGNFLPLKIVFRALSEL
jgi:hypothetical protein